MDKFRTLEAFINYIKQNNNILEGKISPKWFSEISEKSLTYYCKSLSDYINILIGPTLSIWSIKDNKTSSGQFDYNIDDFESGNFKNYSYVCFSKYERKIALEYRRPFGIEFKTSYIEDYVKRNAGTYFIDYNQFDLKSSSKLDPRTNKIKNAKGSDSFNDLKVVALGIMSDNKPFIKIQNWNSRTLEDSNYIPNYNVYNKLKKWFLSEPKIKHKIIHLKNDKNDIGYVTDYIVNDEYSDNYKYNSKINFNAKVGNKFKYIKEVYTVTAIPEYGLYGTSIMGNLENEAPKIQILSDSDLGIANNILDSNKHNLIDSDSAKFLSKRFFEAEYRLYMPNDSDFYFTSDAIRNLLLPEVFTYHASNTGRQPLIFLKEIYNEFLNNKNEKSLTDICLSYSIDSSLIINQISKLFEIIGKNHYEIKWFEYEIDVNKSKPKFKIKLERTDDTYSDVKKAKDYLRYNSLFDLRSIFNLPVTEDPDDISTPLLYVYDDNKRIRHLIHRQFNTNGNVVASARIGAEAIIIGLDSNNNTYINLEIKGDNFLELPGGGFNVKPESYADISAFIKKKINLETGLNLSKLKMIPKPDINQGIYMYEGNSEKYINKFNEKSRWQVSYYYLVPFVYTELIDSHKRNFYNKRSEYGENSVWINTDAIKNNHNFMNRYKNIIPIIDDTINKIKRQL